MVETWSNSRVPGLLIDLRRDGGVALHRQIETAIRDAIQAGRLRIGASLPPTRALRAISGCRGASSSRRASSLSPRGI